MFLTRSCQVSWLPTNLPRSLYRWWSRGLTHQSEEEEDGEMTRTTTFHMHTIHTRLNSNLNTGQNVLYHVVHEITLIT